MSKAEIALDTAKSKYMETRNSEDAQHYVAGRRLMGINEEVEAMVGKAVGGGYSSEEVQAVAEWIRGGMEAHPNKARYSEILGDVYEQSGEITSAFAKTFHLGTTLLEEDKRRSIWAVYVWCRRTDEIVDAPREEGKGRTMLEDLSEWEVRLERLWDHGEVRCVPAPRAHQSVYPLHNSRDSTGLSSLPPSLLPSLPHSLYPSVPHPPPPVSS